MIMRTLRLLPMASGIAAMLVLGGAADALATSLHPAVSCGEPCDPIGNHFLQVLIVGIESLLGL
jgi:hypothetical protein